MKIAKGKTDTSQTFLYRHSSSHWWPALEAQTQIFHYKKGELIFKENEEVAGVYFMVSGVVKIHKHWAEEKELIIRFAKDQDIIGHRGLSSTHKLYPISATALTDVTLCFISLETFEATARMNGQFAWQFLLFMADELQLSEHRMRDLAHMPVKGRVAKTLLALEKKFGVAASGYISFAMSRQDIAAYAGAAYETVYKLLLEFNDTQLIKVEGKNIQLLDRDALENLS